MGPAAPTESGGLRFQLGITSRLTMDQGANSYPSYKFGLRVTHYETDHLEDVKLVQNFKNLVYLNCQHLFASNGGNQSGNMIEVPVGVSDK